MKHLQPRPSGRGSVARYVVLLGLCAWRPAASQQEPVPTFGTTVVIPSGLRGEIFYIRSNSTRLPSFKKLKKPKGVIYTESLNVPPQNFLAGFPGVTNRFEWFAINYAGKFWIEKPGEYRFSLTSDDGAQLYIDDQLIIDNDGLHPPATQEGMATLSGGIHRLRVPYFQGPRTAVALVLKIAGPGEDLRLFSTEEFKPPPNPADWKFPEN
jgi:hypothetical protein